MSNIILTNEIAMEMGKSGVIYGHKQSKTHPKMKSYIGVNKNGIELLKPEAVLYGLNLAIDFLKEIIKDGKLILFVGTHSAAQETIRETAEILNSPYVTRRWLGGTVTNFKIIKDRLNYYANLKEQKEKGGLLKYTKREQLKFSEELRKLGQKFDGIVKLTKVPDVLFVVDPKIHETAVLEAVKLNIPVIAIMDNDDNTKNIEYVVAANDHSKSSIKWIMEKIVEGVKSAPQQE